MMKTNSEWKSMSLTNELGHCKFHVDFDTEFDGTCPAGEKVHTNPNRQIMAPRDGDGTSD